MKFMAIFIYLILIKRFKVGFKATAPIVRPFDAAGSSLTEKREIYNWWLVLFKISVLNFSVLKIWLKIKELEVRSF